MTVLLYGYLTCSSSFHNGYNTYPWLNYYFDLENRTYTEEDAVFDYDSIDDCEVGRGDGKVVLLKDKLAMMKNYYLEDLDSLSIGPNVKDQSMRLILIVSVLGVSTLIGFYFLKRKKVFD